VLVRRISALPFGILTACRPARCVALSEVIA
jgi:hypothetical protein